MSVTLLKVLLSLLRTWLWEPVGAGAGGRGKSHLGGMFHGDEMLHT